MCLSHFFRFETTNLKWAHLIKSFCFFLEQRTLFEKGNHVEGEGSIGLGLWAFGNLIYRVLIDRKEKIRRPIYSFDEVGWRGCQTQKPKREVLICFRWRRWSPSTGLDVIIWRGGRMRHPQEPFFILPRWCFSIACQFFFFLFIIGVGGNVRYKDIWKLLKFWFFLGRPIIFFCFFFISLFDSFILISSATFIFFFFIYLFNAFVCRITSSTSIKEDLRNEKKENTTWLWEDDETLLWRPQCCEQVGTITSFYWGRD